MFKYSFRSSAAYSLDAIALLNIFIYDVINVQHKQQWANIAALNNATGKVTAARKAGFYTSSLRTVSDEILYPL